MTLFTTHSCTPPFISLLSAMLFAPAGAASSSQQQIPGLIAHYELDANALDSSGANNHGVVNGATPTDDRFGNAGAAMQFSGNGQYIVADASQLPVAERTVSFWFKANTVANHPPLLGYGGGSCGTSWVETINNASNPFQGAFSVQGHCVVNSLAYYYTVPPVGEWMHWLITTSPQGTRMYVDGTLVNSNTTFANNTHVAGRHLTIGCGVNPSGFANAHYFDGAIDDVRIYDRALTTDEVHVLWSCPCPATFQPYGSGCGGVGAPAPILTPSAGSAPVIGSQFITEIQNVPFVAFGMVATNNTSWQGNQLPLPMSWFDMPGCWLLVDYLPLYGPLFAHPNEIAMWALDIPSDVQLIGKELYQQALVIAPGANPRGLLLSNGGTLTLGFQ